MSGFEATRAIRRMEAEGSLSRTPILALTANVSTESSYECTKSGMGQSISVGPCRSIFIGSADDFLSKPILIRTFLSVRLRDLF